MRCVLALVLGAQSLVTKPSRRPRTLICAEPPNVPQDLPFDIQRRVDEAKRRPHDQRGRGNDQSTIFNVRFDSLEVQRKATKSDKDALDSQYNFFAKETLFKRRLNHVDGRPCSSSDDRAFYDVNPEAARLRRLPSSSDDASASRTSSLLLGSQPAWHQMNGRGDGVEAV